MPTGGRAMSAAGGPDDATHSAFANRVDDELKGYLKEVSEAVANAADEEEKELLVENALQEVNGKELKVCTDAECSRMLETLVVAASPKVAVDVLCRLAQRETLFSAATKCAPWSRSCLACPLLLKPRVTTTATSCRPGVGTRYLFATAQAALRSLVCPPPRAGRCDRSVTTLTE